MGWVAVDRKLKDKEFTFFISYSEDWEMDILKEVILEEIPWINDSELSKALIECYNEMSAPRPRFKFLKNLRQKFDLL